MKFFTRGMVAVAIGVAADTVKSWETGKRPVPGYAIKWLVRMENDDRRTQHRVGSIRRSAARRRTEHFNDIANGRD